ncbi:selenoprotein W-like [Arapaima gigas]
MTGFVRIQGYRPKFTKLKTLLEDEFPGDVEITGESTPTTTGWFEVEVNGKLVHSKKRGDATLPLGSGVLVHLSLRRGD